MSKIITIIMSVIIIQSGISSKSIAEPLRGLSVIECHELDCTCFQEPALKIIADGLKNERRCQIEVNELKDFIKRKHDARQKLQWWQQPSAVVGGVTVSFVLGGLIVWAASK